MLELLGMLIVSQLVVGGVLARGHGLNFLSKVVGGRCQLLD